MSFVQKITLLLNLLLVTAALNAQTPGAAWRHKVSGEVLTATDRGQSADILVAFREQADLGPAARLGAKTEKATFVLHQLQTTAARSQARALQLLRPENARVNSLFLVNAISVGGAQADLVRRLAELPEVAHISNDPWVYFPAPATEPVATQRNGVEWGLEKINAPAVWNMGFTGQGVTVGGADTGFDWLHPALQASYRGWDAGTGNADHDYNWHDAIHELSPLNNDTSSNPLNNPCGLDAPAPCDDNNHGTHTMGTMTGDDGLGNQIGVAPGAQWVACRNMERGWGRPSSYLECFQWFLAPTDGANGQPDPSRAPHVINNSWYCAEVEGCTDFSINEMLRQAVIALRASGVVVVVSNGNFGASCNTTYAPPAYFEESFSIGSIRSNDTISGFSSTGPVTVDSSFRVKPNVVAPGSNVRSSIRNGGYAAFSGTSMAGPHVAGLVALILSAQPALAGQVEAIETIVEESAVPIDGLLDCMDNNGLDYPNNTYGYGRVDALQAVNLALNWTPPLSTGTPAAAQVRIYPNPVGAEVVFDIQNGEHLEILQIFSADGRLLRTQTLPGLQAGNLRWKEDLSALASGAYFYRLSGDQQVITGRLVKE